MGTRPSEEWARICERLARTVIGCCLGRTFKLAEFAIAAGNFAVEQFGDEQRDADALQRLPTVVARSQDAVRRVAAEPTIRGAFEVGAISRELEDVVSRVLTGTPLPVRERCTEERAQRQDR